MTGAAQTLVEGGKGGAEKADEDTEVRSREWLEIRRIELLRQRSEAGHTHRELCGLFQGDGN